MQRLYMSKLLKKCILGIALASHCSIVYSHEAHSFSDEEAFLVRRIAEFWKDGDFAIVKTQIQQFIDKYPSSEMCDYLHGILGDLLLQENNFSEALAVYNKISDSEIVDKIILNKLQCYYELDDYGSIYKEGERYLSATTPEFEERHNEYHFIMAESYFREALKNQDPFSVQEFAQKAEPFYEELLDTEYGEVSSFALAEVYKMLGKHAKGADLYLVLAEKYADKKENLLFNAALLESNLDKEAAIQIFDRVIDMHGTKAHQAAYNRLLLYYQTQQFDNVIANHRLVYPYVPDSEIATFYFIVGKSFFALEDYESAVTPLEHFVVEQSSLSDQFKDALFIQMTCAKELNSEPLFKKALDRFTSAYPDDDEMAKAHFMYAMILKKEGQFAEVEKELQYIIEKCNNFDDQESLLYEYACITHENNRYDLSYQMLKNFLATYPNSEKIQSAWRYFLSCCLHLSKEAKENPQIAYEKDLFLSDLQKVLTSDNGLSQAEIREYRLLYAKLAYELNFYNESLETLKAYVEDYPGHESLGEAHMLTALSLNKLNADLEGFCSHLETAMQIKPDLYDTGLIHLQLFNAYISRAEQDHQNPELTEKAASYLYFALKDANNKVKMENQLWLGGYYFNQVSDYLKKSWTHTVFDNDLVCSLSNKAYEVYERALLSEDGLVSFYEDNLYLESEMLKFAQIAGQLGQKEQKLALLKHLVNEQSAHPSYKWEFKRQALFELAQTYEELKNNDLALETYSLISQEPIDFATPITYTSKLKAAMLQFDLLDHSKKQENNSLVTHVLNQLKELQIRKNALSEPVHLEAALKYVQIRAELSEKNMKDSRYLFFLVRMKEDFMSKEDSISADYHTQLKDNPSSAFLYNTYMDYIDAEILRIQAKQLQKENKKGEAQEKKQQAYELLTKLENSYVPSKFLLGQINSSLKKLK